MLMNITEMTPKLMNITGMVPVYADEHYWNEPYLSGWTLLEWSESMLMYITWMIPI